MTSPLSSHRLVHYESLPFRFTILVCFSPPQRPRPRALRVAQPASQPASQQSKSADGEQLLPRLLKRKTSVEISMLGNFVGYLFGNSYSGTQASLEEDPRTRGIMRRFRQVAVEDDEWILIDRTVEGTPEEPWYEMPPAVFTQEGPIKVATSPMENLLIEHPSMSVYSVVSGTTSPVVAPDTPPPSPNGWTENQKKVDIVHDVSQNANVLPNVPPIQPTNLSSSLLCTVSTCPLLNCNPDQNNIDELSRRVVEELQAIHNVKLPAFDSNNNRAKIGNQLWSAQERAQEVFKKRSTQSLKRARLEKNNKVRQTKGKRLRRQDRLRVCHSGANNNRKC